MSKLILMAMFSLFIFILNTLGTCVWVHLYVSGKHTEWFVFIPMFICGLTALAYGIDSYKRIRNLILRK